MARAFMSDERKMENGKNQIFSLSNENRCVQVNKKWNCSTVGDESLRAIGKEKRQLGEATIDFAISQPPAAFQT